MRLDYLEEVRSRGLNSDQMNEVKTGLRNGLSTSQVNMYAKPEYDFMQMQEIRLALEHGMSENEIAAFASPEIDYKAMQYSRMQIEDLNSVKENAAADLRKKHIRNIVIALSGVAVALLIAFVGFHMNDYLSIRNQALNLNLKEDTVTLAYDAPFAATDYVSDYTKQSGVQLILPSNVDTKKLGEQEAVYTLKNSMKSITKTLMINVVDQEAPVITLNTHEVTLTRGTDTFSGKAYLTSAVDDVDGDLTEHVTWNDPDSSADQQTVQFKVTDSSGNTGTADLIVHFKDPDPAPEPETIIIYKNSDSGTKSSGSSSNTTGSSSSSVSHGTADYLFSDGYDMDTAYQACIAAGSAHGAYSCKPLTGSDGLYTGYELTY